MMQKTLAVLTGVAFAALLGGCGGGLLDSQKIEYKSAGKLPPLEIPPDLTSPGRDDRYAVPDIAPSGTATFSTYNAERAGQPRTGSTEVLPNVAQVHIERAGTQRWLVVPEAPEKVWPVVKSFWQENGLLITVEQPEAGVMETDWAENRAKLPQDLVRGFLGKALDTLYSTGERDKFRTRLERGQQPGTTEIYISHRGMEEVYTQANPNTTGDRSTRWQPRAPDPELEAEFLARLMMRFGVEEARAREQTQGAKPVEHASISSANDGTVVLQLDEPFDRAWRRVGLALDRVGFTVEDRDRTQGEYYVRYVDQDVPQGRDDGMLSRLMFWRSRKSDPKAEQYRVRVRDNRDTSQVLVLNRDGSNESSDTAKRILTLLHQQLK